MIRFQDSRIPRFQDSKIPGFQDSRFHVLQLTGAGSSYASAQLISALVIKPSEIKDQQIDMLLTSRKAKVEQYDVTITSYDGTRNDDAIKQGR